MARLVLLRHANAPAIAEQDDKKRTLSELGFRQCSALEKDWRSMMFDIFLCLISPAIRTSQTSHRVTANQVKTIIVPELYLPADQNGETIKQVYARLGKSSLGHFRQYGASYALTEYGLAAADAINSKILHQGIGRKDKVLICGHAILLQALAFVLVVTNNHSIQICECVVLNETDGLLVDTETKSVGNLLAPALME